MSAGHRHALISAPLPFLCATGRPERQPRVQTRHATELTDRAPRSEEEEMDMRICLGDDGKIAIELRVKAAERNVFSQGSIFEP